MPNKGENRPPQSPIEGTATIISPLAIRIHVYIKDSGGVRIIQLPAHEQPDHSPEPLRDLFFGWRAKLLEKLRLGILHRSPSRSLVVDLDSIMNRTPAQSLPASEVRQNSACSGLRKFRLCAKLMLQSGAVTPAPRQIQSKILN